MKLIIIKNGGQRHFSRTLDKSLLAGVVAGLVALPLITGLVAYGIGAGRVTLSQEALTRWQSTIDEQQGAVRLLQTDIGHSFDASAQRIAELQARLLRLDALGERLVKMGRLDEEEFNFSESPAMGGPEGAADTMSYQPPAYMDLLAELAKNITQRETQLGVLEALMARRKMDQDVYLEGRPVGKGWLSSPFGYRTDPINGRRVWHKGIDLAGKEGTEIIAVAAGVVVYAGERRGYGQLVEINHGSGYSTRYGHQRELKVKAGDVIRKGDVVGLMGNTGRSTGPHVHFEVLKKGQAVNPSTYIHRSSQ